MSGGVWRALPLRALADSNTESVPSVAYIMKRLHDMHAVEVENSFLCHHLRCDVLCDCDEALRASEALDKLANMAHLHEHACL